jgi:uncharacterized protein YceK
MRWLLWAMLVFVLAGCSSFETYAIPVSGRVDPVTASVDYDAVWKAFVHRSVLVHEQKPEHPFWSAERLKEAKP